MLSVLLSSCTADSLSWVAAENTVVSGRLQNYSSFSAQSQKVSILSCAAPQVHLYKVDGYGNKVEPAVDSVDVGADGSFSVSMKSLGGSLITRGVLSDSFLLQVSGCASGSYLRPVTGSKEQDISLGSSLISYILNTNQKEKLVEALKSSPEDVNQLIALVSSAASLDGAYERLIGDATAQAKFTEIFGASPQVLTSAAPEILDIALPVNALEHSVTTMSVTVSHWSSTYQAAYEWKLNNSVIGVSKNISYIAGGNQQGVHELVLTVGESDGAGGINLSRPVQRLVKSLIISNNILPIAPAFAITSPQVSGGVPSSTRSVTVTIDTGTALSECESFSSLLLTEEATAPSASASFPISCTQAGGQDVSFQLASPGDGLKNIYLWAKDSAGVISATASVFSVQLDTTAPTLSITTQPLAQSKSSVQSFTFAGDDGVGAIDRFECRMDSGGWNSCSSPVSYSGLNEGGHVFNLRAYDTAGNVSGVVSRAWHIDLTPPELTLSAPPPITNAMSAGFTLSATDSGGSGVSSFSCSMDGAAYATCTSVVTYVLGAGSHVFKAQAYDGAGNASSVQTYSWIIDTTPPTVTITSKPAVLTNSMSATFAFAGSDSGGAGISGYECQLDGAGYGVCATGKSYASLGDGSHTFQVRAIDAAGNVGVASSYTWTVDTTTPMASISSSPDSIVNQTAATFAFSATPPTGGSITGYQCNLNSAGWTACVSPKAYSGLIQGTQNFQVRSVDNNSNLSHPTSYSWVIDTTLPTLSISEKPDDLTNSNNAQFVFSGSDSGGGSVGGYLCQLDGAGFTECSSPRNLNSLAAGAHTFDVKVMDTAGNSSVVQSTTWVVDLAAPTMSLVSKPAILTNSVSAAFTFSSSDPDGSGVAGYVCSLDGAAAVACMSGVSYGSLSAGAHSFEAAVYDHAGNYSGMISYSWTVDLSAPTANITSKPDLNSSAVTASFGLSGVDFGGGSIAEYKCKLDSGSYAVCSSGVTYSGLGNGDHTFSVYAMDTAGNQGPEATYTWNVDTVAPTLTIANPASNGTVVPSGSLSSFAMSGLCSEHGATVTVSGVSALTTTCVGGSWSVNASLSAIADGTHSLTVSQTDAAGNVGTATRTLVKDSTAPAIILATPGGAIGGGSMTVTWTNSEANVAAGSSFTVELFDGTSWSSLGTKSAVAGSNSASSYSLVVAAMPVLNTTAAKVRVSLTDAAGNTGSVTSSVFVVDSAPPGVVGISLNSGAATTNSNFVNVSLQLTDNFSANYFCVKYNTTTAPVALDSCWVPVSSSLAGTQTPGVSVNIANYSFQLGYGASSYKVYAWSKDSAGNISSLSNSGAGTSGTDMASIIYTPGLAPAITSLVAIGADLPATQPPSLSDTTIASGSSVYIRWAASGSLISTPISLYYKLTSSSSWTQVSENLVNAANGGCTADDPGTAQVETGCYVWAGGSPSTSAYQIQIRVKDTSSMVSMATTGLINSGRIQVIAGNTDPGVGGSAKSAMYFPVGGGDQTLVNQLVVAPNGNIYIYDSRGIFIIEPSNGISKLLISRTGTNNVTPAGVAVSSATLDSIHGITLDYNQNILVRTGSAILRFPSNVENPTIKRIIGGGSSTASLTAPLSFDLSGDLESGGYAMLTPLPNGDIYFSKKGLRSYYKASDGLIHNLVKPSGIGIAGYNTQNIAECSDFENFGIGFNPETSALTTIIANAVHKACPVGNAPTVMLDPTTMASLGTYPSGADYSQTWGFVNGMKTGLDGSLYAVRMATGRVAKFNPTTKTFSYFVGNGKSGYCPDGTLAANCPLSPQSLFVAQNGAIYLLDNGQIRTVLPDNTIYTLYGAFAAGGDGDAAPMARLGGAVSVQKSDDGKIQVLQSAYNVIREIGTDGIINRIAGNWNLGTPDTSELATNTTIKGTGAWGSTTSIHTDPVSGNIYYIESSGVYVLDRTTSKWTRIIGGGGTSWLTGEGVAGLNVKFDYYGIGNVLARGSTVYIYQTLNWNDNVNNFLMAYDGADNYKQSLVFGAINNTSSSLPGCAVGGSVVGCIWPRVDRAGNPFFSSTGSKIFTPYNGNAAIWVYQNGALSNVISTTQAVKAATYRLNSSSEEIIYYCNGSQIYQKNITTGFESVLSNWPSGVNCHGTARDMIYDPVQNRLIFIFSQNSLLGVAAYYLAD